MVYLQLFWSFFKIGAFTLGGGYAAIPLVEREVVQHKKWMLSTEFVDFLALAQSIPGVLAVSMAVFTGHHLKGVRGSLVAVLAAVLPSFCIMLAIAMGVASMGDNVWVDKIFRGLRPAVVALIAIPVLNTAKSAHINYRTVAIPVVTALLVWGVGLSPVYMIVAAAAAGIAVWKWDLFGAKK